MSECKVYDMNSDEDWGDLCADLTHDEEMELMGHIHFMVSSPPEDEDDPPPEYLAHVAAAYLILVDGGSECPATELSRYSNALVSTLTVMPRVVKGRVGA